MVPRFRVKYDLRRVLREAARLGLTQRDLARRAGVTPFTITRLSRGYNSPSPETMRRLAGAVGLHLSDLTLDVEELPRATGA